MSKKKQKHDRIKVVFKDGRVDIIPDKFWDDYETINGFLVLTKKGCWTAMYNLSDVSVMVADIRKLYKK